MWRWTKKVWSPIALSQMTRTTLAVNELKKKNLPYIICFVHPQLVELLRPLQC